MTEILNNQLLIILITGMIVGAASGLLGSFMVLKRMSLVGDALSHVALPGMALALTYSVNPMFGALAALVLAVLGIWYLGERTEIYSEALVGIFFTGALAIGILITPEPELLEALFGSLESINLTDGLLTIAAAIGIFLALKAISHQLLLGVVSEDLAKSAGMNVSRTNLVYLVLVGLAVALGVKFIGTLLTGALLIIPAAAAKNLAQSINIFQLTASIIGLASAAVGILIAWQLNIPSGPAVVLVAIAFFIASYLLKKK